MQHAMVNEENPCLISLHNVVRTHEARNLSFTYSPLNFNAFEFNQNGSKSNCVSFCIYAEIWACFTGFGGDTCFLSSPIKQGQVKQKKDAPLNQANHVSTSLLQEDIMQISSSLTRDMWCKFFKKKRIKMSPSVASSAEVQTCFVYNWIVYWFWICALQELRCLWQSMLILRLYELFQWKMRCAMQPLHLQSCTRLAAISGCPLFLWLVFHWILDEVWYGLPGVYNRKTL